MAEGHVDLIKKAKEILIGKGFKENEIYEEFGFKNYRIDVVGWSDKQKIAIECGHCSFGKYEELKKFFDEVIHLPFEWREEPLTDSEIEAFEVHGNLDGSKVMEAVSDLTRIKILQCLMQVYPKPLTLTDLQKLIPMKFSFTTISFHI